MYVFHRFGFYHTQFFIAVILFFRFLGHLACITTNVVLGRLSIAWFNTMKTIFRAGARLVIPLMLISALMGISLVLNVYNILSPYNLQHKILIIAQRILIYDLLPLLISLVLCMQCALNLINARIKREHRTIEEVLVDYVIPIIIGVYINALLLYTYSLNTIFISIYFTFYYILHTNIQEYLFHLTRAITLIDLISSIIKTLLYCTVVSLIVGYYYYQIANDKISLRKAMARIMTRGLFWLGIGSIYLKYFNF